MPKIVYEKLSFQNGYIYRSCEFPLDQQGLVLIRGLNLDDGGFLGSGKTSLFEVFATTQIGKGGKSSTQKKDEMINWSVGSGYEAILTYTLDGRPYEIRQYRKHPLYKNRTMVIDRDTGRNIIPRSASRFPNKWIREEHLRVDETSFFNLIYLKQELNHVLLHGREYERRQKLTPMFGLDVYDRLHELVKSRLKSVSGGLSSIEHLEAELETLKAQLEGDDSADLEIRKGLVEKELKELQVTTNKIVEELGDVRDLAAKLSLKENIENQIAEVWKNSRLHKVVEGPSSITDKLVKKLARRADSYREKFVLAKKEVDGLQKREQLEKRLADLGASENNINDLKEQLSDAEKFLAAAEREAKNLESQLKENVCGACKRPFEEFSVEDVQGRLKSASSKRKSLKQKVQDLKSEIQTETRRKELLWQLENLPGGSSSEEELHSLERKSSVSSRQYEDAKKLLDLCLRVEDLPIGDVARSAELLETLNAKYRDQSVLLSEKSVELARLEERIANREKLSARLLKVKRGLKQGQEILDRKRCLDALKAVFGNQGLKSDRFSAILREATETTVPLYSSALWPNGDIDLQLSDQDGSIKFQLHRDGGEIITDSDLLSGGERHKAGMAFLFGIRDLKALYTESSTNVLIVDEPFGSLDPQGTAGLMRILKILKAKFGSVFVISHRPEVLNYPDWDQTWWAVRKNNESTLYKQGIPEKYKKIAYRASQV